MMITTSMVTMNLAVETITYDDGDGKVYGIEKAKGWRTCCDRRHIGQVTPSQLFFCKCVNIFLIRSAINRLILIPPLTLVCFQ